MTLYTLYIKSGMNDITPEILNVFLRLLGHDAIAFKDTGFILNEKSEYNRIEFHDLKEAQKTEKELRKMFYCYIIKEAEFDKTGMTQTRLVNVTSFKESGKYYDNFNVEIPADTPDYDIVDAILKKHSNLPEYFIYHGYYANNVPFIIPAHTKFQERKPYKKLEMI